MVLNVPKAPPRAAADAAPTNDAADAVTIAGRQPLRLRKPIRTHSGETRELKFREPIGSDYIEIGELPFDLRGDDSNRRLTVNFKIAAKWISRLTGVDEILVGQLSGQDWLDATARINAILMDVGVEDLGNSTG